MTDDPGLERLRQRIEAEREIHEDDLPEWGDFHAAMAGDLPKRLPNLLKLTTSVGSRYLLYRDKINGFFGESGDGKSWLTVLIAVQMARERQHVVIIDFEDTIATFAARLKKVFDLQPELWQYIHHVSVDIMPTKWIIEQVQEIGAVHVIIDSLGEALNANGVNQNDDGEVGKWIVDNLKALQRLGIGSTNIDHGVKAAAEGAALFPSGSQRKRAAISGAMYRVRAVTAFAEGRDGVSEVITAKDRGQGSARGDKVALLCLQPAPLMSLNISTEEVLELRPPPGEAREDPFEVQRRLAEQLYGKLLEVFDLPDVEAAYAEGRWPSARALEVLANEHLGISWRKGRVGDVLQAKEIEGVVISRPGPRGSTEWAPARWAP